MKVTVFRRLPASALIAVAALTTSVPLALAQTTAANPPPDHLTLAEIETRLASEGLTIHELEVRDRLVEVEAYDADGREVDLVIDRRTGEVLSRKLDR